MKKFLSLVLALIMTMSLVTIGAGATEYKDLTDKDEIQYEEAVAVLNRIGVITGYEDGSFRPETELTRGAAAKIIVSLLIGPEAASNLPNDKAPYPDVPASHTFAGVISYCKTAGIISGYGDGTFKPGNSLTGFAFAKMLLGALGYKAEIEGFVDTGWTMNVARVGNVTGLFDRLDFKGADSVNREEACQLALNTLKATMVTYGGTTLVTGAQTLAVQGTQAMYVTSNNREINANINRRVISAQNNELTLEFGEEHFKDLRLEHDKFDPAYDDYGHPSNEWSWKKVTIGTFKLPADFTYTKQMSHREDTVATKEKALGLRGYDTYSTDHRGTNYNWSSPLGGGQYTGVNSPFADATQIHINGYRARANEYGALKAYDATTVKSKDGAPTLSEIADLTDNGVTVEVYVCPVDADYITDVVVTRTQLMEVKRIGSDYVTLSRIDPDSRDPRKDEAEKDSMQGLKDITGYNAFAIDVDTLDVKDNNFDAYNTLKDLKAGDKIAVIPFTADQAKTWEVGVAYVPETVSGKLSDVGLYMNTNKVDGNATSITVGGTNYVINEWNLDMIDVKKAQINATRKDVTAYLATDGTVLWATEIGNSDAWMVVGDYYQAANSSGKVVWFAHGWTIGGEEVDVDLGTIRKEAEYYAPGELVHYQLAQGGTGEYELGKPNNTGSSSWYSYDGQQKGEERLEKTVDNKKVYSGEGVYNVAQFVLNSGVSKPYSIHPANSLIALEDYTNYLYPATEHTAVGGAIYAPESDAKRDGTTPAWTPADGGAHTWNYRSTTYKNDGVKFIYVNFDSVTGNVDYISTRKDAQNVENAELAGWNKWWSNVSTNTNVADSQKDWVISPAEAYVNKDGHVEAVVIKCEPAQADLSNVVIVGEYVGTEYGKVGAEGDTVHSNVSAREYWQGPNFSEKKTGYFKNGHNVGDIVVIRSTDANGVMDCKMFNGGKFENRNPDVFTAEGIAALKSAMDNKSKIAFYVGKGKSDSVYSQDGKTNLKTAVFDGKIADIMSDLKVEAETWDDLTELERAYYEGLIKVAGAKWIDLRANRGSDEVESLSDLLDLDNDTVKIKVLLNAKGSTDTFRRAYAIVVLRGYKLSQVEIPELQIQAVENAQYVSGKGAGTSKDPWIFEVEAGKQVRLHGVLKNASKLVGCVTGKTWTVNDRVISADAVSDTDSIWVDAPEVKGDAYGKLVTWTVSVRDDTKADRRTATSTVYAKVVVKEDAPATEYVDLTINNVDPAQEVTFTAEGQETVKGTTTAKLVKGVTYTATVADGYTVTPASVVAGTTASVTVTKDEEPTGEKEITVTGTEGAQVIFKDEAGKEYPATVGTAVKLPTGVYLTVTAVDSANHALACKNVGTEAVPFAASFKIENVDSVRVYVKGSGRVPSAAWDADATNGGNGLTFIPAEAAAGASEQSLIDTQFASAPKAAGDLIIKVTTAKGVAFLSAPSTGRNAGLYTLISEDADGNKCPASISDVVTALIGGAVAEDVTEADVKYDGGEEPPVPPVEAADVKAKISSGTVELYAYYGTALTRTLTEEEVFAAVNEAVKGANEMEKVVSVDLTKNTGAIKTNMRALALTAVSGSATSPDGSYRFPKKLYKVTIGEEVLYVEPAGKITVGEDVAALLEESKIGAAGVASVSDLTTAQPATDGVVTLPAGHPTKDITFVPAVKIVTGTISGLTSAKVDVYVAAEGKEPVKVVAGTTDTNFYVQKGAQLNVVNTDDTQKGKPLTLEINGEVHEGAFDGDGVFNETFSFGENAADASVLEILAAVGSAPTEGIEVFVDGESVGTKTERFMVGKVENGAVYVKETVDRAGKATLTATAGTTTNGEFWYTPVAGDQDENRDDAIYLVTAYPVTQPAASGKTWKGALKLTKTGELSTETADVLSDSSAKYVIAGTKIYVQSLLDAATRGTLKLADDAAGLELSATPYGESGFISATGHPIYVLTVNGAVDGDSIEKGFGIVTASQTKADLEPIAAPAAGEDFTEFEVELTVVGADVDDVFLGDFEKDAGISDAVLAVKSVEYSSETALTVTMTSTAAVAATQGSAKALGTLKVGYNDMFFSVALKLAAGT